MYSHCKKCNAEITRKTRATNPRFRLWSTSRSNADAKGLSHTIALADIPLPKFCRYLGVELDYQATGKRNSFNGASIDRIDPSRGYVPGNIQIISDLANRMKNNATLEQLVAFARGVLREHGG